MVETELQLAALRVSAVETPSALALEVTAPHVEWAKMLVSMRAKSVVLFSQWPIVATLTGL